MFCHTFSAPLPSSYSEASQLSKSPELMVKQMTEKPRLRQKLRPFVAFLWWTKGAAGGVPPKRIALEKSCDCGD